MLRINTRSRRTRPGIANILAAVILFAMVFTTGFGYLIYVTQGSLSVNQANANRENAALQASQEVLRVRVFPEGHTHLGLAVNNTGGIPVTMSSILVVDNTGKLVGGPYGPVGTNISAAMWPISLPVGLSTHALGDSINLTSYIYTTGTTVTAEIITARGNTFSAAYPTPSSLIPIADVLVVKLTAGPSETLTCNGCVKVNATVYNYAASPVTSVSLSSSPPVPQVTGSASVSLGSCSGPSPSSTIPGYTGSGNAPHIIFYCTYSAQTGAVGGVATFSTSATGNLKGAGVSSAEAMSNGVQIGGNANVPTQGAFAANYFFLKYSSCQNYPSGSVGSYFYSSPCTTLPGTIPPASLGGLEDANYISAISDAYVAYYVQVTNVFNTTLPLLQYSYLFMDPGVSTEAYSFLVGTTTTPYYPDYCGPTTMGSGGVCGANNLPVFTPYTATAAICSVTPSLCIDVAPGQTVTLTFAACGWNGATNWVWGGTPYAEQLDSNTKCINGPPAYQNEVPEGQTFAIVLSYLYGGQVYSQVMPFEGQTVTNLRLTSTSLSCLPSPDAVNQPTTCTATVTDLSPTAIVAPTGSVTFAQAPSTGGTFSNGGTCTLSGSGAIASCSLTYTPSLGQEGTDTLTATYPGDTNHQPSSGQTSLSAIQRSTSTGVVCTPSSALPNISTNCVVTVSDSSPGTVSTPSGTVTLTQSPASSGTFTPAANCLLAQNSPGVATCSVTYTPKSGLLGTVMITGSYGGDFDHTGSSNSASVTWARKTTTTTVSCSPTTVAISGASTCTATVTGFAGSVTGETMTWSQSGTGSMTFGSTTCSLSAGGTCPVTVTGLTGGSVTIQASYPGDVNNAASSGTTSISVKHATTTAVTCSGQTCTATVSGYTGSISGETITFSQNGGTGTITFPAGTTCSLSGASCSVQVAGTNSGSPVVQASYPGDANNIASTGSLTIAISADSIAVSCLPTSFNIGVNSICTATLSGFTAPVTGETITFSQTGGTGSVTFVSTTCSLAAGGTCPVTITGNTAGSAIIQASYPGDTMNSATTGTQSVAVTSKHPAALVQTVTLCTNPASSTCSGTLPGVTSGDVIVVAIGTEKSSSTCTTVSSLAGTRGDSSYTVAPGGSAAASYSGVSHACAYSAVFYASVTSSGSDTITLHLTSTPTSGDVVAYEVSSALLPPAGVAGSCNSGACTTSMATSSLSVVANSFLITAGTDCPTTSGTARQISSGPAGFAISYGVGKSEYIGYDLPGSPGSQTFSMTISSSNAACWSDVGAQFVDPPPPPGWNASASSAVAIPAFHSRGAGSFLQGSLGLGALAVALGCETFAIRLTPTPHRQKGEPRS